MLFPIDTSYEGCINIVGEEMTYGDYVHSIVSFSDVCLECICRKNMIRLQSYRVVGVSHSHMLGCFCALIEFHTYFLSSRLH